MVDKARLLGGDSTEIHEVITRETVDTLEQLNERLQKAVANRILAAKVIEVEKEPESDGTPKMEQPSKTYRKW